MFFITLRRLARKNRFEETADMFCENELHLLCDTLRKGHVRVSIGTSEELSLHLSGTGAELASSDAVKKAYLGG